ANALRFAEPLKQKHCFCAAKALARLDRANDTSHSGRKISNLYLTWQRYLIDCV
ncbi:hypothetical protein HMPREF1574_01268, partial [Gardnerella pickettii JCP7659]